MVLSFENNQIITASHIMILMYEMTMKERFNMIGPSKSISRVLLAILVKFSLTSILIGIRAEILEIRNLQESQK